MRWVGSVYVECFTGFNELSSSYANASFISVYIYDVHQVAASAGSRTLCAFFVNWEGQSSTPYQTYCSVVLDVVPHSSVAADCTKST